MSIFDFFRRRSPSAAQVLRRARDDGERLSEFPQLRDAWLKLQTDYLDEAREIAGQYVASSNSAMAAEATKLVALVTFRKRDYASALPLFERVAAATGKSDDLFNVMTCSAILGQADHAQQIFDELTRRRESGDTDGPSLPQIWYYFGCSLREGGHPSRALPMVEKLRAVYEQLRITDDTFVYIRGVPFLSNTLTLAFDVFRALGSNFDACGWLQEFSKALDEDGQSQLRELMDKLNCPKSEPS